MQSHKRRLSRKQKEAFLAFANTELQKMGYPTRRMEQKKTFRHVHLETTQEQPLVIFMAHYDTPTMMPPWFELLFRLIGHTRQISATIALIVLVILVETFHQGTAGNIIRALFWLSFLCFFIPNPQNWQDNTSGVLGLLQLAREVSKDPRLKDQVKFVLVDHEEAFLTGSLALREQWVAKGIPFRNQAIISLDCIGRGKYPVLVKNDTHSKLGKEVFDSFQKADANSRLLNLGFVPVNDNYNFRDLGSIVITFMDKSWIPGGFVIKNIHSPFDRKLYPEKIQWVVHRLMTYLQEGKIAT